MRRLAFAGVAVAGTHRKLINLPPVHCVRHQETLVDSLLLLDWKHVVNDLQRTYKNSFLDASKDVIETPVKPLVATRGSRLATNVAVTCNSKTLWLPFIVDTGAPSAVYISAVSWEYLGVSAKARPRGSKGPTFSHPIGIGKWIGDAHLSDEHGETDTHLQDVNVLGIGLLGDEDVAVALTALLNRRTERRQMPTEVWVTVGTTSFTVKPEHMKVAHLKDAIKAKCTNALAHVDAPNLIVKSPDGAVLGNEDDLQPGVEYSYALPK